MLLWSTDDDSVVTVFNGQIHAKGVGSTTVHAYSQSGSVKISFKINVLPVESDKKVTISTDDDTETIVLDKNTTLNAKASNGERLTYTSSNPSVATVNSHGKVVATGIGTTYIIIKSESGAVKRVQINVKDALDTDEISLGLKVLYNDSAHKYWSAETGTVVKASQDGQYTVKFDCNTDCQVQQLRQVLLTLINLLLFISKMRMLITEVPKHLRLTVVTLLLTRSYSTARPLLLTALQQLRKQLRTEYLTAVILSTHGTAPQWMK